MELFWNPDPVIDTEVQAQVADRRCRNCGCPLPDTRVSASVET